jgi:hypothetical protein
MEYTFFSETLCERFMQFVQGMGLSCQVRDDVMEGRVLKVLGELDDGQMDALEEEYEGLMDEQMLLAEEESDLVAHRAVGIGVRHASGETGVVRLPVEIARKLMAHFSAEEIQEMVQVIADALEQPDAGPLCRKA